MAWDREKIKSIALTIRSYLLTTAPVQWLVRIFGERWGRKLAIPVIIGGLLLGGLHYYRSRVKPAVNAARSWIYAAWPLPKARPGDFTVVVAKLSNDPDGRYRNLIVHDLEEVKWIRALPIERTITVDGANYQENPRAGHAKAVRYLREIGAQILIWGTILKGDQRVIPELYLTGLEFGSPPDMRRRYVFTPDLNLPLVFWNQLANVLDLVVATDALSPSNRNDYLDVDQLTSFIKKVQRLLDQTSGQPGWNADSRAVVRASLAAALKLQGEMTGGAKSLEEAALIYEDLLKSANKDSDPRKSAGLLQGLAQTWIALAGLRTGPESVRLARKAMRALDRALTIVTKSKEPIAPAAVRFDLSDTLLALGYLLDDVRYLRQGVQVCRQAVAGLRSHQQPFWTMAQVNLAHALIVLSEREVGNEGAEHLKEAVNAYQVALKIWTPKLAPLSAIMIEGGLARAFLELGERDETERGRQWLGDTINMYQLLTTQEARQGGIRFSTLQELALAVQNVSEREQNSASVKHLAVAIRVYRTIVEPYPPKHPTFEAYLVQAQMGDALRAMGRKTHRPDLLCEAMVRSVISERGLVSGGALFDLWGSVEIGAQRDASLVRKVGGEKAFGACMAFTKAFFAEFGDPPPPQDDFGSVTPFHAGN